ncbi:MAG TPA: DHA2 family efflux MFS transporter permease subunit [Kofleriaceae bacterium]|jgi:EmrB/QacA subfamily drug resistance transporter
MRPNPWATFATCCLSIFLVSLDVTAMNVALPSVSHELHTSIDGLQWTMDAYTVVIASFLMLAGATADRFGRRRVFRIGLALFTTGSLLCSLSPSVEALIGFRVVQAFGGAMLNPVAMSIVVNTFPDVKVRARAIGMWGAVLGISMALGPILGGVLVQTIGWRAIFWINIPIGITALLLTRIYVPESRAERPRPVDPVGQALVVIGLACLTATLIEGPHVGWASVPILSGIAVSVGAIVGLIVYERRIKDPLIDMRFFKSIPFASATLLAVISFSTFNGALFLSSLYLQQARGLAPSHAGACMLPIAVTLVVCSPLSGRMVGNGHTRRVLLIAGITIGLGGAILSTCSLTTPLWLIMLGFSVFGIGLGSINPPITNAAVSGMPRAQAGIAAGLASTSRQVGASLGVAIAGSMAAIDPRLPEFSASTHPFFWAVAISGVVIVVLAIISTSNYAKRSTEAIAELVAD